jgi:abortive infection bacteriophage resistance protein
MKYDKIPLSFEEQADRLIERGLIVDKNLLVDRLRNVHYYRLSGYLYPYRQPDETFNPGTTFERVWRHYTFDRRLRLIVMDAVERVEVSVKTNLIYSLAHSTQAFGYIEPVNFPGLSSEEHTPLITTITEEISRSKEVFVKHFKDKYGDYHKHLPLWMSGEIMSYGCMLTMYRGVSDDIRRDIAVCYGISDDVLTSWLQTINVIRNICAHHSRLWNRELELNHLSQENKNIRSGIVLLLYTITEFLEC